MSEGAVLRRFSKLGDQGYTSLLSGQRVPKYDRRVEAYGTIDEAVSALGLARALCKNQRVREIIEELQKEMYMVCSELATAAEDYEKAPFRVEEKHLNHLEELIDEFLSKKPLEAAFVLPGKTPASAAIDLARTIVRRAERMVHRLIHEGIIPNRLIGAYLNRLADLLFTLAREEEKSNNGGSY